MGLVRVGPKSMPDIQSLMNFGGRRSKLSLQTTTSHLVHLYCERQMEGTVAVVSREDTAAVYTKVFRVYVTGLCCFKKQ